jgi:hypothetical protein
LFLHLGRVKVALAHLEYESRVCTPRFHWSALEDGGRTWVGKEKEAETIAMQGRDWTNKVLRKEDMEIYMFRLLLEWGRLTDDNREELGYREP